MSDVVSVAGAEERERALASGLAALSRRHAALNEARIRARADEERHSEALEKAKAEARERFGTDDPEELVRKYEEALAEKEKLLAGFARLVEEAEAKLREASQAARDA